ncbi:sugar ABC transporter substrate-binding protein [Pimelobacter simplex]|uniref:sugar ABC transporter substrate-binding protein n=1 Tax=Nocardioides simplex TaxID=2045 RepID=UPI003AB04892
MALLAACGSSGDGKDSGAGADAETLKKAESLVAAAQEGVVSAASAKDPLAVITEVSDALVTTPDPDRPSLYSVAACEDPCGYVAENAGQLAKDVDGASFTAKVGLDGLAWQQLTTSAINTDPAAIIMPGVPDVSVLAEIDKARKADVKTVGVAVEQKAPEGKGYDAYVSVRQDIGYPFMLTTALADSGGKANVALFLPGGDSNILGYAKEAERQFKEQCPSCKLIIKVTAFEDLVDPTALDQLTTSVLNANPDIDYMAFADDYYPFSVVTQAAKRLNRDVTLISQDGSTPGLQAVKAGDLKYNVGMPLDWIAYASYDQVRRLLAGEPALPANGWGGGLHLWTKDNLPSDVSDQTEATKIWRDLIPYPAAYDEVWGP